MQKHSPLDLTRVTLQVLWIGILIATTFWIMKPFLPSLIWAAMIVTATWPLMIKVEGWLWQKRGLAVTVMTAAMLVVFIVPFSLAVIVIFENAGSIADWLKTLETMNMPALPGCLAGLPLIGPKLAVSWQSMAAGPGGISARLTPYAGMMLGWFVTQAGSIGMIALQFLLTIFIAAVFYSKGETVALGIIRLARKLGGHHGEDVAILAAQTVRGVALGVVGTALIQSVLGGIGLGVAGVPAAALLTAFMFMLCVAQLPPALVLIPAVIWLYYSGHTAWATVLLVLTIFISTIDNFLKPLLIRMGADLPILLIFAGVIGGLITFGVVGLFIGPVVLAVTYRLLEVWLGVSEQIPQEDLKRAQN